MEELTLGEWLLGCAVRAFVQRQAGAAVRAKQHAMNVAVANARWRRQHPTRWELALRRLLREAGFRGQRYERMFGRYSVDAYIPSHRIAFEADGHWIHEVKRESGEQEARDAYLMTEHDVLAVIHLTKEDLRPFLTS